MDRVWALGNDAVDGINAWRARRNLPPPAQERRQRNEPNWRLIISCLLGFLCAIQLLQIPEVPSRYINALSLTSPYGNPSGRSSSFLSGFRSGSGSGSAVVSAAPPAASTLTLSEADFARLTELFRAAALDAATDTPTPTPTAADPSAPSAEPEEPESIPEKLTFFADAVASVTFSTKILANMRAALLEANHQIAITFPVVASSLLNPNARAKAYREMAQHQTLYLNNIYHTRQFLKAVSEFPRFVQEQVRSTKKQVRAAEADDVEDGGMFAGVRPWICERTWVHAVFPCQKPENEVRRRVMKSFGVGIRTRLAKIIKKGVKADEALHKTTESLRSVIRFEGFDQQFGRLRSRDKLENGNPDTWYDRMEWWGASEEELGMSALMANYGALREVRNVTQSIMRELNGSDAVFGKWVEQLTDDLFGINLAGAWNSKRSWFDLEDALDPVEKPNDILYNPVFVNLHYITKFCWPCIPIGGWIQGEPRPTRVMPVHVPETSDTPTPTSNETTSGWSWRLLSNGFTSGWTWRLFAWAHEKPSVWA